MSVPGLALSDVPKLTGLSPERFISGFENLGENCEFGFVQRICGAEPLGLLRFGAPRLPQLIACLQNGFDRFGVAEKLEYELEGGSPREYCIREKPSGMLYHTWQHEDQIDGETLLSKQPSRIKFLVRKFIEDLALGEKICVWKCIDRVAAEAEIVSLHAALKNYGNPSLLWVELADAAHPPGTAYSVMPGLIKGYLAKFSPRQHIPDSEFMPWLDICVKAYRLVREARAARPETRAPDRLHTRLTANTSKLPMVAAHTIAHIQNRGDTQSSPDGWVGRRGSRLAVEGFVILDDPAYADSDIRYRAILADGMMSDTATIGQYRGTRGKNKPIFGFLVESVAPGRRVTCEATFVDGSSAGPVTSGEICQSPTRARLETFRIMLTSAEN